METSRYDVAHKFITHNYKNLISGTNIPPLKFIFGEDGYYIFETLKWLSERNLTDKKVYGLQIDFIKSESRKINKHKIKNKTENQMVREDIVVNVPNAEEFFSKLSIIANLYLKYTNYTSVEILMENFFSSGLWLRMTPQDCNDIDSFLSKQIDFLYNIHYLDDVDEVEFDKYTIDGLNETNSDFYETYNRMNLKIYDKENEETLYELPSIHYGITEENYKKVCYIYGIQNLTSIEQSEEIKTAIKKNVKRSGIYPSFILAMKTFIDLLISKDITEIRVPLLEVLNYGYHVLYSESCKKLCQIDWGDQDIEDILSLSDEEKKRYNNDSKIYDHYVDNEDSISKSKTETLAYIFYKIQEQYDNIDIDVYDFELRIKPRKNKVLKIGNMN